MSLAIEKVLHEALSLPAEARINLVEKLLESLNLPTRIEVERLWAGEAERRVSQIDKGEVELIPGEEVFARIREKCNK
jgi:putative addiction module component (TIGR02574 family)